MSNDSKGYISLFEVFKALTNTKVAPEDKDLVKRLTERSMKTTQTGLSGYRVDAPIDDWEKLEEELDKSQFIVENTKNMRESEKLFKESLLILLRQVEIKTYKIDCLIKKLEELKF